MGQCNLLPCLCKKVFWKNVWCTRKIHDVLDVETHDQLVVPFPSLLLRRSALYYSVHSLRYSNL